MSVSEAATSLSSVHPDRKWPSLSEEELALMELRLDPWYEKIPEELIPHFIREAIRMGKEAARSHAGDWPLVKLVNTIISRNVRVRFHDRHPTEPHIRAQYTRKPPTIDVYRSSIDELRAFFSTFADGIRDEDLIRLHLFHEWFHHLEETSLGRTDLRLPRVPVGKRGPLTIRRPLHRTREIAAHAFTRQAMNLPWSPLLIDRLISLTRKGKSTSEIRESFQEIRGAAKRILHPDPPAPVE
ncbi:hypothetical protein [Staphylospora marina]|uniref:hypothetical protein n=1 Tax=Staphylospora marina TaxID=2490858 RepID=UPI000F5BE80A|nr:hypothetical protein [Staphylospora marina]